MASLDPLTLPCGLVVGHVIALRLLPEAVVAAPNAGRIMLAAEDQPADWIADRGIDRQLRIDVGPPAASISLWVMEPTRTPDQEPADPRGTVLGR